jgi:hypothetical protein
MKHRFALVIGVVVIALTTTSSALAFDCMRVSSSPQGSSNRQATPACGSTST